MKTLNKILTIILLTNFVTVAWSQNSLEQKSDTLTFRDFFSEVSKKNLDYLSERYNVGIADAEVIAQKVLPDPELEFEGADDNFSLGLGYTLELGNKRGARVRLAKSQADVQKLALENYYQDMRAEAADLFLDALQQRELLKVKESSYEYMKKLSESDSLRLKAGEISLLDARQSKLEAATLLNDVYDQQAAYKSALVLLNQYMGQGSEKLYTPEGEWIKLHNDYALSDLITLGLNNRIDLVIADKNVEVANNETNLVRAERKMDVDLNVKYERDWKGFLPPSRSVSAGVAVPLKFSNLNKGAVKVAKLGVEQSKVQRQSAAIQAETEIAQAYFNFESAKKKVKQYETGLLDESKKILDGMVYQYNRGETNITDVLVAQRTYNEVQEQYLETVKDYAASLVNLQKTCGIWDLDL